MAGKTFEMWLKKISEEENKCWLEMIPHVLRKYHDMHGLSGLSLYEIVWELLAGLPYSASKMSEDAVEFFKRIESMDKKVANKLIEEHN